MFEGTVLDPTGAGSAQGAVSGTHGGVAGSAGSVTTAAGRSGSRSHRGCCCRRGKGVLRDCPVVVVDVIQRVVVAQREMHLHVCRTRITTRIYKQ